MRDKTTPETDAAERMAYSQEYMVPTEFARKLERERDEAMQSAEAFSALAWKLEGERNEAQRKLNQVLKTLDVYDASNKAANRTAFGFLKKMFVREAAK